MKPLMKDDPDFRKHNQTIEQAVAETLTNIVLDFEDLEQDIKMSRARQKGILSEAKTQGFSVAAIRQVIRDRKRERDEVQRERDAVELYERALRQSLEKRDADKPEKDLFED
jgi:uncharacterized protein (UPF0335 family)